MKRQCLIKAEEMCGSARAHGRVVAPVLLALSLVAIPNIAMAQAPSLGEALDAVVEYVRDKTWVVGDWHLGFDSVHAARHIRDAGVDAATHRESLSRIADRLELPYYSGEDFGRVVCDASPAPDQPAVNCRFPHGTRSMLTLTVLSSHGEHGVTRVEVYSAVVGAEAYRSLRFDGRVLTRWNTHHIILYVEYDRDGTPQVIEGRSVGEFAHGSTPVDEIRGTPPGP